MNEDIGAALRKARLGQRKSLRAMASAVGVSASLLSQVETGKTQPSVSTLYALVSQLGLSLDELMGLNVEPSGPKPSTLQSQPATDESAFIQRAANNPVLEMDNGVRWERLVTGPGNGIDLLLVTYPPGASSSVEGRLMRHTGIEYAMIMEGELTLQLEFSRYTLYAGDSLCFDSSRPHLYLNGSQAQCRGVWFNQGRNDLEHTRSQVAAVRRDLGLVSPTTSPQSAVEVLAALDRTR